MTSGRNWQRQSSDPIVDAMGRFTTVLFGPDRATRARTAAILLCALMYVVCCTAAFQAADVGLMRPEAPYVLVWTTLPAYAVFYGLVRCGWSRRMADHTLMLPQNIFALFAIAYAYTAVGPADRGIVLVLLALVMVFGMYTHTPRQSVIIGVIAMLLIGAAMGVLSQWDPAYYPPKLELLRFELMMGTLPALIYSAYQISAWRNRMAEQRRALREALAQVQQLATRDSLTGLHNRRHMQDRLEHCAKRFERYGEGFAVVLIDLDHFKRINDVHGHKVGDQALQSFASAAQMVLRETDFLSRWGGEEFLFLLPATDAQKALVAVERLRESLKVCTISASVPELKLTFSAGVAVHDLPLPLHRTLERADQALYAAKQGGRDRSEVALPPQTDAISLVQSGA